MINSLWLIVKKWIRENPKEAIFLGLILLVGAVLRLYKIDQYMTFLGDEGRDAIVVRRLLVDFDPILIGPRTSIGDMYLGPLYYYMMAPALALSFLSPVGPAVMVALLGVATIFFVWYVAREWFPGVIPGQVSIAGLIAASLYAISPTVIILSRNSWNPNIMPFFALLVIYGLFRIWKHGQFKWLVVIGVSFAFILQSHYLGLLLAPTIGLFWLLAILKVWGNKNIRLNAIRYTLIASVIFAFLMSPLVIFDARHGWRNFTAMKKFFTQRQTTVSARPWTAIPKLPQVTSLATTRLLTGKNEEAGRWTNLVLVIGVIGIIVTLLRYALVKRKLPDSLKAYLMLLVWLGFSFIGLGVYKQHIYDHYYGFFFTAPFLLIGGLSQNIIQSAKNTGKILVFVAFVFLVIINLAENPLKYPPNRQLQRTKEVSAKIEEEAKGDKFNLAVLAERNYEDAYQYFLEKTGAPVVDIDAQRVDETITEQLFVVCELAKDTCDPTRDPKAQIANFGWSKIEEEWEIAGVVLYKLIHTK